MTESVPRSSAGEETLNSADNFSLMREYFDKQFKSMKRDLREEVQASSELSLKRFKSQTAHEFKYQGNRKQFEFNVDILDGIESVSDLVKNGEQVRSLERLSEVKSQIAKRNKLIKLADKSSGGWDTVREYCSDDLASDSDDDKKIRRAESRALAKRKAKKLSTVTTSRSFNDRQSTSDRQLDSSSSSQQGFRPFRRSSIQCFACGGWGHIRPECPRVAEGPGVRFNAHSISGSAGRRFDSTVQCPSQQFKQEQSKPPAAN